MQLPVNLLTDGTIIKGFNKFGELVAVYDKFENGTYIEYEKFRKTEDKTRLRRRGETDTLFLQQKRSACFDHRRARQKDLLCLYRRKAFENYPAGR